MEKIILGHIGEDYARITVNGLDHEISLGLMRDLFLTDNLFIDSSGWSNGEMMNYIKENL